MAKKSTKKAPKKNRLSAEDALERLKKGNKEFLSHGPIDYQSEQQRLDQGLDSGQQPYAAILSCADSRVSPEIMFNAGLNELFVIRVAGNIATTEAIASIEYAVSQLNTNLIVVLGHEKCGAVGAALQNATTTTDMGYNLNTLVGHLTPAVAAAQKKKRAFNTDPLTTTVKENAKLSAQELRTRSPIIASERGVKIVSGYYHLIKGKVEFSDFL